MLLSSAASLREGVLRNLGRACQDPVNRKEKRAYHFACFNSSVSKLNATDGFLGPIVCSLVHSVFTGILQVEQHPTAQDTKEGCAPKDAYNSARDDVLCCQSATRNIKDADQDDTVGSFKSRSESL